MDRIPEISLDRGTFGKGHIVSELDVTARLWFFACHLPDDPMMPGSVADGRVLADETCVYVVRDLRVGLTTA